MRRAFAWLLAITIAGSFAWGQAPSDPKDDARKGRHLAFQLCIECHLVSPEQPYRPTLNPPAPSFESIASRGGTNAASLQAFLTTTHQGMDRPKGMPHPGLADFQIEQITAYLLSLRK
jgi:mono/diheme cytochrome c family protein